MSHKARQAITGASILATAASQSKNASSRLRQSGELLQRSQPWAFCILRICEIRGVVQSKTRLVSACQGNFRATVPLRLVLRGSRDPKGKLLPICVQATDLPICGSRNPLSAVWLVRVRGYCRALGHKNPVSKPHMWANYFPFVRNVVR